jgi:hypothetical protein
MDEREKQRRATAFNRLFAAFKTSGKANPQHVVEVYALALGGIATDALERSVEQFVLGKVAEHDGEWVPTTAQLVRNATKWQLVLHPPEPDPPPALALEAPPVPKAMKVEVGKKLMAFAKEREEKERQEFEDRRRAAVVRDPGGAVDPRPLSERLRLDRPVAAE